MWSGGVVRRLNAPDRIFITRAGVPGLGRELRRLVGSCGRLLRCGSRLAGDRPIGVGKTAVLHEADVLLIEAGSHHATVELEEIARCWPNAIEGSRTTFAYQNLATLWSNFIAVGASRLLLSALVEQRSDLRLVSEAIPGAAITVVRLHAPLSAL
jgi:hypothetical protein